MAHPLEFDVVNADDLAALDVDDLAVYEVLLQVEVVAIFLERLRRVGRAKLERARGGLHDLLRGDDVESAARFEDEAGDLARVGAGGDGDVLDAAAELALGVGHRGAEQGGETDTGCGARLRHEMSVAGLDGR